MDELKFALITLLKIHSKTKGSRVDQHVIIQYVIIGKVFSFFNKHYIYGLCGGGAGNNLIWFDQKKTVTRYYTRLR